MFFSVYTVKKASDIPVPLARDCRLPNSPWTGILQLKKIIPREDLSGN